MQHRRTIGIISLVSLINAGLMLGLSLLWLSLPYTLGDEAFLIKWTSLVKKSLLGLDEKPLPDQVLFLDVSACKTTIPTHNVMGLPSLYHREVITDRGILSEFLGIAAPYQDQVRLIILDILFETATEADSLLQAQMSKFGSKILTVSHLQENGELIKPVFEVPYALSTYQAANNLFVKYPLTMEDTLQTMPLAMLTRLNGVNYQNGRIFDALNGRATLGNPIVDFKIRPGDLQKGNQQQESFYSLYDLGFILESREFMEEADFASFFQGRTILIGDFETDIHDTPFDQVAGPIILFNAYLTLAQGESIIRRSWILFLLAGFFTISYRTFANIKVERPSRLKKIFQSQAGQFILNSLDEAAILILISICSYFLFNIHVNILFLLVYIKVMEYFWKKSRFFSQLEKAKQLRRSRKRPDEQLSLAPEEISNPE